MPTLTERIQTAVVALEAGVTNLISAVAQCLTYRNEAQAAASAAAGGAGAWSERNTSFTAGGNGRYILTNTLTITDPTPTQGMAFQAFVRAGTATIGGIAYAAGTNVIRSYNSGAWANRVFPDKTAADAAYVAAGNAALPNLANAEAQAVLANYASSTLSNVPAASVGGSLIAASAVTLAKLGGDVLTVLGTAGLDPTKYQGTWNAATNTPTIPAAAVGNNGNWYFAATAGTATGNAAGTYAYGDVIVSNGSIWRLRPAAPTVIADDSLTNAKLSVALRSRINLLGLNVLFTRPGFVSTTGVYTSDANWGSTELLPLSTFTIDALSLYGHPAVASIAFYDANRAFISGTVAGSMGTLVTAYPTPPGGAVFATFTFRNGLDTDKQFFSARYFADSNLKMAAAELSRMFTRRGYINTRGNFVGDPNWGCTRYIKISEMIFRGMSLYGHTAAATVAFYDANGVFISGVVAGSIGTQVTAYTVPGTAVYVVFTCNKEPAYYATQFFSALISDPFLANQNGSAETNLDLARYATEAGYITTTGANSSTDSNWLRSPGYLPLNAGDRININACGHSVICVVAFYNSAKVFISGVSATDTPPNAGAFLNSSVVAPAGTAFVRVSFANPLTYASAQNVVSSIVAVKDWFNEIVSLRDTLANYTSGTVLGEPRTIQRNLILAPTDKVLLYGDSISSTDYTWYKTAMEGLTGAIVYNGGFSGASTATLASNTNLQRIWDYGARVVFCLVGGNDTGASGTVGTFDGSVAGEPTVAETSISSDYAGTYFIQAVSHIIRKFAAQYNDIRTRAALTGSETESEKAAKIDAVLKPVLFFCTTLPQKRNNSGDAFSQVANWKRKRDAVVECCKKYGIGCVDLYTKCNFDMSIEPYWTSPTNMVTNNGVYYMDGLHPNKYGYQVVAEIAVGESGIRKQ